MDFETKNTPMVKIPQKLFKELMDNSEMLKFYMRKCSSLAFENEGLTQQLRKQSAMLYSEQDERLILLAGQFDSVTNEIELTYYEEEKRSATTTEARKTSAEECEQIINYITEIHKLDPLLCEGTMYLSNRDTMHLYAPFCPVCLERAKKTDLHSYRRITVADKKLAVIDNDYVSYVCEQCGFSTENPYYKLSDKAAVVSDGCVDAELIALILTRKYHERMSFLSQEIMYRNIGISLSVYTMAHWAQETIEKWLRPVYTELVKEICRSEIIYSDNVMMREMIVPDLGERKKQYVWCYCTDPESENPVVLYSVTPDDSGTNSVGFLEGFEGILCVDKFECYKGATADERIAGSWAQIKLMFTLSYESVSASARKDSFSAKAINACDKIIGVEKSVAEFDPDIRTEVRRRNAVPVIDELMRSAKSVVLPSDIGSENELSEAVNYLITNEKRLRMYIENGRLLADNICCKKALADFTGSSGWKSVNLDKQSDCFEIMLSLVKTAIANDLEPDRYLCYCLKRMSDHDESFRISDLMPWNAPEECRHELNPIVAAE